LDLDGDPPRAELLAQCGLESGESLALRSSIHPDDLSTPLEDLLITQVVAKPLVPPPPVETPPERWRTVWKPDRVHLADVAQVGYEE
jgi:hypothetical protein